MKQTIDDNPLATEIEETWDNLCPDGALRFYEGDDPEGFAAQMLEEFGFDVRSRQEGWEGNLGWDTEGVSSGPDRAFVIPAGLVGAIYGSDRWPLGS